MTNPILISVLAAVVLLGGALLMALRADRRRQNLQQRLRAVATMGPSADEEGLLLRRPLRQSSARALLFLPAALLAHLDAALVATGNSIGPPYLLGAGTIAAIVVFGFTSRVMGFDTGLVAMLCGAAAIAAPIVMLRRAQSKYQLRFLELFPDALDLIGRAVKAGLPVFDAMEVAAREISEPVGSEFRRTLDEVRIGVEIEDALRHTADRVRVADFRFYMVALALQRRTGGSLAETLSNLSNVIRRRRELRRKARALTAEPKASASLLSVLPFVVGGLLYVIDPELMSVLTSDRRGRLMVGIAVLSLIAGRLVMAFLIKWSLR